MVATLQSRKEALEAKIQEKNEELKKLCLQEADLTGVMPPEIPLEPGEPPPPIRRRIGTSFSFPQNLINNMKDADDESLTALELEFKVQTNICEAALALANDTSANKSARRKHRLMYRQSQRRLMELESRLNLLKQGKAHQLKPQQVKKKPRPNTTAVENLGFFWDKTNDHSLINKGGNQVDFWPSKIKYEYFLDDIDGIRKEQNEVFGSLQRSNKSTGTSNSSGSPRTDLEINEKLGNHQLLINNLFSKHLMSGMYPQISIQDADSNKVSLSSNVENKRTEKKGAVWRQWDTQSAGYGTLLPSQTYPDHSHQPNLSRTQSLGNVESKSQKPKDSLSMQDFLYETSMLKEREWYETSLDSAPSPPLRTTSKLPSTARILHQMQDMQLRDLNNRSNTKITNLQSSNSQPILPTTPNSFHNNVIRSVSAYPTAEGTVVESDSLTDSYQQIIFNPIIKGRNLNSFYDDEERLKEFRHNQGSAEVKITVDFSGNISKSEGACFQAEVKPRLEIPHQSTSVDSVFLKNNESDIGLPLRRQNSLNKFKNKHSSSTENSYKSGSDSSKNHTSLYVNIPEDSLEASVNKWLGEDVSKKKGGQVAVPQECSAKMQVSSQPYYHNNKNSPVEKIKNLQYQAARNRHASNTEEHTSFQLASPTYTGKHHASIAEEHTSFQLASPTHTGIHHPPHAIIQNEISFDTVVPFESPQNHTVVQAGKWQPYREVTKPFEMSDFYKYSTKFRQNKPHSTRANTPDITRHSPLAVHQKGVYTPLKPMTCRPVESTSSQMPETSQTDSLEDSLEKTLVEVSPPEIV